MTKKTKGKNQPATALITAEDAISVLKQLAQRTKCTLRSKRIKRYIKEAKRNFEDTSLNVFLKRFVAANANRPMNTAVLYALLYTRLINMSRSLKATQVLVEADYIFEVEEIGRIAPVVQK